MAGAPDLDPLQVGVLPGLLDAGGVLADPAQTLRLAAAHHVLKDNRPLAA